ncbi:MULTISPECIES: HAD family hydrolase [Paenibacillus]|uniref:HAD family hydrolase n=1 Tax=Paenibacillus TaxID=44249 RepID=UPI0022B93C2C|nr:HAD family hydrolase [Paenibacillus caseinilyticus]MCZ8521477.1 HAD family hydrolase [Paenibacillus caseinilyticus]
MIQGIVFDFDGLILDTETPEFESFQALYRRHGCELTLEVWGTCIGTGPSAFDPYQHLEDLFGSPYDREEARVWRRSYFDERMASAELRPGVLGYLQTAHEEGLRVGLASSSPKSWVTGHLAAKGILDAFECIRTADDVEQVKPDPALYLLALEGLGVSPGAAVAFEDSPNGALAAKRAGMFCVAVPNETTSSLPFGEVDLRIGSMSERSLLDIISILEARACDVRRQGNPDAF